MIALSASAAAWEELFSSRQNPLAKGIRAGGSLHACAAAKGPHWSSPQDAEAHGFSCTCAVAAFFRMGAEGRRSDPSSIIMSKAFFRAGQGNVRIHRSSTRSVWSYPAKAVGWRHQACSAQSMQSFLPSTSRMREAMTPSPQHSHTMVGRRLAVGGMSQSGFFSVKSSSSGAERM